MSRQTLQSGILESIGNRIIDGEYKTGQVLRTDDWETEFDVSRTVLREALKVLESMRLISMRRKIGVTVRPESEWNVFDPRVIRWRLASASPDRQMHSLTELRLSIEPIAARNAALKGTATQRAELLYHATQLEDAGLQLDLERLQEHDIAFHSRLLEASGNEMFAALAPMVTEVLTVTGRVVHDVLPENQTSPPQRAHTRAAEAIMTGNPVAAENAMRELLLEIDGQMAEAYAVFSARNAGVAQP
ncbi:FadR/GntR family transcriptional regulator [Glaciibacter superstes]|uniref:FadR/GntR family transcriptional regulator n=1 Tax=Glaciibacter superstes TaxID=501023 RepID=UPI0003B75B4C|nr:FadR/GntR family transcriptional regulator [Glaciibacter superstes]